MFWAIYMKEKARDMWVKQTMQRPVPNWQCSSSKKLCSIYASKPGENFEIGHSSKVLNMLFVVEYVCVK